MGFEVLTVVRIHNVVELGHHIVWYIHGYECLEERFGSVYMGHQTMEAVGPGQIVCADHLNYMDP